MQKSNEIKKLRRNTSQEYDVKGYYIRFIHKRSWSFVNDDRFYYAMSFLIFAAFQLTANFTSCDVSA